MAVSATTAATLTGAHCQPTATTPPRTHATQPSVSSTDHRNHLSCPKFSLQRNSLSKPSPLSTPSQTQGGPVENLPSPRPLLFLSSTLLHQGIGFVFSVLRYQKSRLSPPSYFLNPPDVVRLPGSIKGVFFFFDSGLFASILSTLDLSAIAQSFVRLSSFSWISRRLFRLRADRNNILWGFPRFPTLPFFATRLRLSETKTFADATHLNCRVLRIHLKETHSRLQSLNNFFP